MEELSTTILRCFVRGLGIVALCTFATVGTMFAETITKTFEFGAGTSQLHSHVRTFPIPCGSVVGAVTVKFQRIGPKGPSPDFPIRIELREPDIAADQEGPIVDMRNPAATLVQQTVTLYGGKSKRGCTLPWRVRVGHDNDGTAPFRTFGSITVNFDSNVRNIDVETLGLYGLYADNSTTLKLGASSGLEQGRIEITGAWKHWVGIGGVGGQGPLPVKFRFELIDPSGAVVATAEGYSSDEARSELPKLKLTYNVTNCIPGQWKIRVGPIGSRDAGDIKLKATFTPDCP